MSLVATAAEFPTLCPYASAHFNAHFWHELNELAADVASALGQDLIALVLGGGFGRGEGCVTMADGVETPYNDVDLFLITESASTRTLKKLTHLAKHYEHSLKIAVDFSRPQTIAMISRWEHLLMWQELVNGHLVLCGPEDILTRNVSPALMETLPMVEASRLLLNRGAGLLLAARVALGLDPASDDSFVARNYFKCAQSLADATLIAFGQYCSDPSEKQIRMGKLAVTGAVPLHLDPVDRLRSAMSFRSKPHGNYRIETAQLRDLAKHWCELWLWLENRRLGLKFVTMRQYTAWTGYREARGGSCLRILAANVRRRRIGWHHPRERVYRSLPASLQELADADSRFIASSLDASRQWRGAQ